MAAGHGALQQVRGAAQLGVDLRIEECRLRDRAEEDDRGWIGEARRIRAVEAGQCRTQVHVQTRDVGRVALAQSTAWVRPRPVRGSRGPATTPSAGTAHEVVVLHHQDADGARPVRAPPMAHRTETTLEAGLRSAWSRRAGTRRRVRHSHSSGSRASRMWTALSACSPPLAKCSSPLPSALCWRPPCQRRHLRADSDRPGGPLLLAPGPSTLAAYTLLAPASVTPSQLVARVVLKPGANCLMLATTKKVGTQTVSHNYPMLERTVGPKARPAFATVKVCSAAIPAGLTSASVGGRTIPAVIPANANRVGIMADTAVASSPDESRTARRFGLWPRSRRDWRR